MVNYRLDFENCSAWQHFTTVWPSWDTDTPGSLWGIWPGEAQSEGCKIQPRAWMILVRPLSWPASSCDTSGNFSNLNWCILAYTSIQWRWYPNSCNRYMQNSDGRSSNHNHLGGSDHAEQPPNENILWEYPPMVRSSRHCNIILSNCFLFVCLLP